MEKPFFQFNSDQFIILPTDIKLIEGYETPKNEETGKQFPYCCPFHQGIYENTQIWFDKFPDCCEPHKELKKHIGFDKSNYVKTAQKVVSQLSYTEHFITQRIDLSDWYKDITDYIDYNVFSFGTPPVGLDKYLQAVINSIDQKKIPNEKKIALQSFLNNLLTPKKNISPLDLNVLFETYQTWLKIFPFDISIFKNLKDYFSKQFPILKGKGEFNRYTGFTSIQVQTQTELVTWLTETTKIILQTINSVEAVRKGLIADTESHSLDLINESHRIKQLALVGEFSKGEMKYVTVLGKWLMNEKEYFKEISPLLKKRSIELKQDKTKEEEKDKSELKSFSDIFTNPSWEKYISALEKTSPPLLNSSWEFIGKPQKHKGVVCSWIKHLQLTGIIKQSPNRFQLAVIVNKAIKKINIGKDGKTFDNYSSEFEKVFKQQLIDLTK